MKDSGNRQMVGVGKPNDGNISVHFLSRDLEARADFIPPAGDGAPLTIQLVQMILDRLHIIHGLRWDEIRRALRECNYGRRMVKDILIAKGEEPVDEIGPFFAVNASLYTRPQIPKGNARVDYRSYTPFIIVKKGQVLAKQRPRREGKNGMNVRGEFLPFQCIQPTGVRGGEHTRTDGDLILAETDGQMVEKGSVLDVKETLTIKGPVGYATGNIVFPGDVYITGPVSDGFKIYAGGSLTIKQTFDVTEATVRGDLCVKGGVIGRGRGLLKIGGTLHARFIENCRVAVRKGIAVERGIVNSHVWTLEGVDMGDRSLILGTDIYARKNIKTGGIGKKEGKASKIYCGIDFALEQEKEKNNNLIKSLGAKIRKLRELLEQEEDSEKRNLMEEDLKRAQAEQRKAAGILSGLLERTVYNEDAAVEVAGEVMPGTLIELCRVAYLVTEPLHKIRIKLEGGMVVT
ncbi:MAG: FapA family protein, partial [Treponema sp.]|nr:FapA family protein [Treponema sp.]